MFFKLFKWTLLAFISLGLLLVLLMHFSARSALDTDLNYSKAVQQLPMLADSNGASLARMEVNDRVYRVRIGGFEDRADAAPKPTVILLHGWPVTSAMWEPLIAPLVEAGYRVLAPDQRGYSPGARPLGKENYTTTLLSADIIAMADALNAEQFHLAGHDWGAVVGWQVMLSNPDRVLSWAALSIAHPQSFSAAVEEDPDQAARSRYFFLFATPWLAETVFSMRDFGLLKGVYGPMPETAREEYLALFAEPGALTAAFNWYRAMTLSSQESSDISPIVNTPTLFIWGNQDGAVGRWATEDQAQYMQGPFEVIELDAGHWLMEEKPDEVIKPMLNHLQKYSNGR